MCAIMDVISDIRNPVALVSKIKRMLSFDLVFLVDIDCNLSRLSIHMQ